MLLQVAVAAAVLAGQPEGRQADFAAAAEEYGVPVSVLLGVSYLQSRWDAHAGEPSTAGGYGPMHLLDPSLLTGARPLAGGAAPGHVHGDARGDSARPLPSHPLSGASRPESAHTHPLSGASRPESAHGLPRAATVDEAARVTGISAARLRRDPAANIRGGAALLASYQREPSADPARWHAAVTRYAGSRAFADEVLRVIRDGAGRRTDDGSLVRLPARPALRSPATRRADGDAECPRSLECQWMPAAYARTEGQEYGNHDRPGRPRRVDYIVVHDTETPYRGIPRLIRNPAYVSWHYTVRSRDGHVAQHVKTADIAWHAGNWDVNTRSIGIEHEGYLASGGTWYTEAMYRASARLVRHLAAEHDIPLDRAHILGHDNVPGTTPETHAAMHEDPGPYWDWAHYFDLLGAPLDDRPRRLDTLTHHPAPPSAAQPGDASSPADQPAQGRRLRDGDRPTDVLPMEDHAEDASHPDGRSVLILPEYDTHRPRFTGCERDKPALPCPPHGASAVWLRTAPRHDAPLVDDIGKRVGEPSTYSVYDHSARASAGQRFALAGRRGEWTAIWYLGRRAWFHDPADRPAAVRARGPVVVPLGPDVKVYGRAYPEKAAYRGTGVAFQRHVPLPYRLSPGQAYTVGETLTGSYHHSAYQPAEHVTVGGRMRYHQIQLGHRVAFVRAEDVRLIR